MSRSKGKGFGCVMLLLVLLVVTLYAGAFQTEEMNQLFNWIFR